MFARLLAVGTRPCKKTCPKKTRRSNEKDPLVVDGKEGGSLSLNDQRRIIDRFVDLGLTRYLESRDKSPERDKVKETRAARDYQQLLYDWAMTNEDKRKRTCEMEERFTTIKPGSIIKDAIPIEKIVLMQAPFMDETLQSNLSDKAFQEAGDIVGAGIDTSQEKIYKGAEAIKIIGQLTHRNLTTSPRTISTREGKSGD